MKLEVGLGYVRVVFGVDYKCNSTLCKIGIELFMIPSLYVVEVRCYVVDIG